MSRRQQDRLFWSCSGDSVLKANFCITGIKVAEASIGVDAEGPCNPVGGKEIGLRKSLGVKQPAMSRQECEEIEGMFRVTKGESGCPGSLSSRNFHRSHVGPRKCHQTFEEVGM